MSFSLLSDEQQVALFQIQSVRSCSFSGKDRILPRDIHNFVICVMLFRTVCWLLIVLLPTYIVLITFFYSSASVLEIISVAKVSSSLQFSLPDVANIMNAMPNC